MEHPISTSPMPGGTPAPDLHFLFDDAESPAESRFLQWLTRLPLTADVPAAAHVALRALDHVTNPSAETRRFRAFLTQATVPLSPMPRRRGRLRH